MARTWIGALLTRSTQDGQNSMLSVVGPIATSVGALRLMFKSILSQQPWLHDPLVAEIPWRDEQEQAVLNAIKSGGGGQLAFGVLRCDDLIHPQPPVVRAIETVVKTIEKLGHKVIEWTPPSHKRGIEIAVSPFHITNTMLSYVTSVPNMGLRRRQRHPRCLRPLRRRYPSQYQNHLRRQARRRIHRVQNRRD
jgi:Asp-tRNA(Asn)/Glu-tRNA(Gln) amidotransferase A subunit family amidase